MAEASSVVAMIALAALFAPIAVPILPPEKLVAYMKAIHFEPPRTETSHTAALPQHFADQFGWEEMVASVAQVYHHLRPEDQKRAAIYCQNYGEAGAIDFFGPKYGLPPAISGHQNYFLWGPRDYTGDVVLVLDTALTTSASNSARLKIWGKWRAARGRCPGSNECTCIFAAT